MASTPNEAAAHELAADGRRSDGRDSARDGRDSAGGIRIVHVAERFVVIDKPAGMLSVPGKGPEKQDCAAARVRAMFPGATGPLVVHRLDMETSGLLVFGLDEESQRRLSRQFEERIVRKSYIALLDGMVEKEAGEIRVPMRTDIDNRPRQIVDFIYGRHAVTRFCVLAREVDRTRVRFEPITGRTHQLRVHASWRGVAPDGVDVGDIIGRPILGDGLYGEARSAPRLMLHAARLAVRDPDSGRELEFESVVPF